MTDRRITDKRAAELARLCEAATPGPWDFADDGQLGVVGDITAPHPVVARIENRVRCLALTDEDRANGRLMATARTALPDLLADRATDRERIADLEALLREKHETAPRRTP